jgi:phospholipid/cholesterol/gamma-HCH transport system permease protein
MTMDSSLTTVGTVQWLSSGGTGPRLRFAGNWTVWHLPELETRLDALKPGVGEATDVDFSALGRIDTAGAGLIAAALGSKSLRSLAVNDSRMPRKLRGLLDTVSDAVADVYTPPPTPRFRAGLLATTARLAREVVAWTTGVVDRVGGARRDASPE